MGMLGWCWNKSGFFLFGIPSQLIRAIPMTRNNNEAVAANGMNQDDGMSCNELQGDEGISRICRYYSLVGHRTRPSSLHSLDPENKGLMEGSSEGPATLQMRTQITFQG
ncbi:hypothetical protein BKA67DRAFT_564178 [Truncatella angustata]|uniref:Uncharacterized protein n=1 Tax=Truncatella angustata TaxID=152316 RepID=A0A9P8ZYJ9_9PEZI|nr:uncharacterized protein BKA67DRAFT_564178 [Truncatella angustata]KAH6654110.1 hypothetical protein BKA67DRAFT_564178 [Truncatella angustata]